ncbi:hypothetical protein FACS1894168_3730 [Deltaproteobacteria bacterium]|nr:hypothetical protein FACS1894168_3730 [Deltaproteobacteria bacterium]
MNEFNPISMRDMVKYREYLNVCGTRTSDYSFTNLWGWAEHYGLEWHFSDNLCWIRQTKPSVRYWAPIGDWKTIDWKAIAFPAGADGKREFCRVPEDLRVLWQEALSIEYAETRGQWDYLYLSEELASLSGNKFHKKKNLLNQFLKKYPDYHYNSLNGEDVDAVLQMQKDWCIWNECKGSQALLAENTAVLRVLSNWNRLPGIKGGYITVQEKVIAYTVGEELTPDTLVVHFEKGATQFKGIYQAINAFFVCEAGMPYQYINREQDLDDPGLRKAKESYNPTGYIEKSTVRING